MGRNNVLLSFSLLLSAAVIAFPSYYDRFIALPPDPADNVLHIEASGLAQTISNSINSANRYVALGSTDDQDLLVFDTQTGDVIRVMRSEVNPSNIKLPSIYDTVTTFSTKIVTNIKK